MVYVACSGGIGADGRPVAGLVPAILGVHAPSRQNKKRDYFFPFLALSSSAARASLKRPVPACEAARLTALVCSAEASPDLTALTASLRLVLPTGSKNHPMMVILTTFPPHLGAKRSGNYFK